jgi:hypothetical protein
MSEEIKYVHHDIKNAVFDLVCLAYPYVKTKSLVDNLHKDCKDQIEVYEREHKALEIIKSHAKEIKHFKYLLYMAKYWEENKTEVTEELLFNYDFPYAIDEFNLLKEVMK